MSPVLAPFAAKVEKRVRGVLRECLRRLNFDCYIKRKSFGFGKNKDVRHVCGVGKGLIVFGR